MTPEQLGEIKREFKPGLENLIAGIIIGLLMFAGGCAALLKGVAKYALPKIMSKSFVMQLNQGDPVWFNGTTIKGHLRLAEMIKEETDQRRIPWEIVEEQGY